MNKLEYITNKFKVDPNQRVIELPIGRWKDFPRLLNELGVKTGAEIGVYRGVYSRFLLKFNPSFEKLYGVDAWKIYDKYKDYEVNDIQEAELEARELTKKYPNYTIIKGWSREVASQFEDESLDFVFIDGNHAYEYVVEDIALWSKKVRKGGIVCGHDYDDYSGNQKRWMDMHVIDAVNGWVNSYRIAPLFILTKNQNHCWFYIK